uniref:Uncharacterized protein n=1 Tax=Eptatretus burgeri TaxID=7764 RepID=A0A8C4Q2N7_EPTBU
MAHRGWHEQSFRGRTFRGTAKNVPRTQPSAPDICHGGQATPLQPHQSLAGAFPMEKIVGEGTIPGSVKRGRGFGRAQSNFRDIVGQMPGQGSPEVTSFGAMPPVSHPQFVGQSQTGPGVGVHATEPYGASQVLTTKHPVHGGSVPMLGLKKSSVGHVFPARVSSPLSETIKEAPGPEVVVAKIAEPLPASHEAVSPTISQPSSPISHLSRSISELSTSSVQSGKSQEKQGSQGTPVPLSSNYMKLNCLHEAVYQYSVSFSPEIDSKNMRFALISEHKSVIGEAKAFDGSILYLPWKIDNKNNAHPSDEAGGKELL